MHFQPNDAIKGVGIASSHLKQIPSSLKNLNNSEELRIQHSFIQHLDLKIRQQLTIVT